MGDIPVHLEPNSFSVQREAYTAALARCTRQRLQIARKALQTLSALMHVEKTDVVRDAAIQRFEYSFEAVWKAAQRFLVDMEGIQAGSPKRVIRESRWVELFDEAATRRALAMTDDRNLTVGSRVRRRSGGGARRAEIDGRDHGGGRRSGPQGYSASVSLRNIHLDKRIVSCYFLQQTSLQPQQPTLVLFGVSNSAFSCVGVGFD